MPLLNPHRFDHLSESEVIRRIGDLVALMWERDRVHRTLPTRTMASVPNPVDLLADSTERQIAAYLSRYGETTARRLAAGLALPANQVRMALVQLRAKGLCKQLGRTSGTRYQLRQDFSDN